MIYFALWLRCTVARGLDSLVARWIDSLVARRLDSLVARMIDGLLAYLVVYHVCATTLPPCLLSRLSCCSMFCLIAPSSDRLLGCSIFCPVARSVAKTILTDVKHRVISWLKLVIEVFFWSIMFARCLLNRLSRRLLPNHSFSSSRASALKC